MDLYYLSDSPPCRAVLLTAKALGIELNKIPLDFEAEEHLKPEFVQINPQHTVPTLVDGDFILWESRAIMIYLVEKYGQEDDPLYPKCPEKRALINQRLYFDMGTLFGSYIDYYYPQMLEKKPGNPELLPKLEKAMEFLDIFLSNSDYAAGDTMTLADLAFLVSVSSMEVVDFDIKRYENVYKWYENIKEEAPGAAEDWEMCLELKKYLK
ncbi:glutathione S-transferase 2 [Stomoxys calcitrans]|uniref:Uncharacterized protein n=1 Tax=Stomoxys calcitrans TaxID=35570 RepID=A0A1I8NWP2_STOCA|nr:glutathione S-transferase 2 [Stomoxys calcitrans]XP_013101407.1 glutathione S-transferase 2 [Stomoxys calcitrans]XP_013101408.1 glutathione S-transferase 2 [Stomoxys calcitrans]XP_013101409.1 glutathione S-transferase 2 [Stomoxys calcitrans]